MFGTRLKNPKGYLALLAGALVCGGAAKIGDDFWEDSNFRTVQPGAVYRAGQVRAGEWDEVLEKAHAPKTVLNLRGAKQNLDWYALEQQQTGNAQMRQIDYKISATSEPSMAQMDALVQILREAPKPLLIHCKNGADRTGLVSALYVYAVQGRPAAEARQQLTLWYGHFPWLTSRTGAMDRAFDSYVSAHPQQA